MSRARRALLPIVYGMSTGLAGQALPPLPEAEGILLRPLLDRRALGEDLLAIPSGGQVFLPLSEICRLLAFDILVSPGGQSASGTFLTARRTFHLSMTARALNIDGRVFAFGPEQVRPLGDEIYVEAGLLTRWFPLSLDLNLKDAVVIVAPREGARLPILDIWEREGRYSQFRDAAADSAGTQKGTRTVQPYRVADLPSLDFSLGWGASAYGERQKPEGSVTAAGDLLWMSSLFSLVHDPITGSRNSRGTLFREDPSGGLAGPLHARKFELGDLRQPGTLELVGSLPDGRGFSLDNQPLEYRTTFGTRTFRGQLASGWTVELYQNGSLLGFRRSRADGRYEFPEVPLRFGMNDFQLVFIGPFGERRKETFRLDIAGDQPPPGAFYYHLAGSKARQDTSTPILDNPGLPQGNNAMGSLEYGVNPMLSLKAGGARVELRDGPHQYAVAGVRTVLSYFAVDFSGAQDRSPLGNRGEAFQGLLRTGFGYNSLSLRRATYQGGFQTPALAASASTHPLRDETQADLNASSIFGQRMLSLGGTLWEQTFLGGEQRLRSRVQMGLGQESFSLTAFLGRSKWAGQNQSESGLTLSTRSGALGLQGEIQSQSQSAGERGLVWSLSSDYQNEKGLSYRALVQKTSPASSAVQVQAGAARMTGSFGFGVDGTWSRAGGWGIALRLQVSLQREPRSGQWTTSAQSLASSGSLSARAYLDENGNGRLDPGERVLEGARFTTRDGSQLENHSHDPRIAWYTQLGRSQWVPVAVDTASLEDLSFQPSEEPLLVLPRPGKVICLDFPVQVLGEVTGTTRRWAGIKTRDLGGLEVELRSKDQKVIRRVRAAYDGFFEIRGLPLGAYVLTVSPAEVKRLRLQRVPQRTFVVDATHTVHDGQDLLVELSDQGGEGSSSPPPAPSPAPADSPSPTPTPPAGVHP